MTRQEVSGLRCALLATMCWACNYPVSRYMLGDSNIQTDEWYLSYLRLIFAVIVLLPFTLRGGDWQKFQVNWKTDWKMFLFLKYAFDLWVVGWIGNSDLSRIYSGYRNR